MSICEAHFLMLLCVFCLVWFLAFFFEMNRIFSADPSENADRVWALRMEWGRWVKKERERERESPDA